MAGLKTPVSVIWQVVKARTEGMGFNATARTFEKAKNTILAWERKFRDLHQVLFLYALVHEFLALVIEGDEAYTKVQKNVPPDQSPGWTILLLDRASRFIWEIDCGGTGSVEWEWLPILKQSLIQTPVQFSRDPYVVEIPGRMGICMPYVVYPINSSRVFVRELFYIQIA